MQQSTYVSEPMRVPRQQLQFISTDRGWGRLLLLGAIAGPKSLRRRDRGMVNLRSVRTEPVDLASRTDPVTSTTELAGFLGADEDRLFGVFTQPSTEASGVVLMCSSLYSEAARNYRREVILARELAARGIASLRFHYRGSGYSDGDPATLDFRSMIMDAAEALTELRERYPSAPAACLGTRLGAFVSASLARSNPSMALLLWDPVDSPAVIFQDVLKARRASTMIAGH